MTYRARCDARHARTSKAHLWRWVARGCPLGKTVLLSDVVRKRYEPPSFRRVEPPTMTEEAERNARRYWLRIALRDRRFARRLCFGDER